MGRPCENDFYREIPFDRCYLFIYLLTILFLRFTSRFSLRNEGIGIKKWRPRCILIDESAIARTLKLRQLSWCRGGEAARLALLEPMSQCLELADGAAEGSKCSELVSWVRELWSVEECKVVDMHDPH